jgi:hypothetical protein
MTLTRRAVARVALAAVLGVAAAPARAPAHGEASPLVRSVIQDVEPRRDGLTFTVVRGPVAQISVRNRSPQQLEILDPRGEPFIKVGARGVFGDVASPAWAASGNPDGAHPPGLREGAPARWRRFSTRPEWTYYDHRLHPSGVVIPPDVRRARETVPLRTFSIPIRLGGEEGRVRGYLEFRPVVGQVTPALTSTPAPLPGVTTSVLPGRFPGLLVQNAGRSPVVVLGPDGEVFARIGPRGVAVNLRSPVTVDALRQRGEQPPVAANPAAPPRWRRVSATPSYAWLEPRVRYEAEQPPDAVVRRRTRVRLKTWEVPLRAGRRRAVLRGTTTWVPTNAAGLPQVAKPDEGSGGTAPAAVAGGAAFVLALGAAAAVRLRRRDLAGADP